MIFYIKKNSGKIFMILLILVICVLLFLMVINYVTRQNWGFEISKNDTWLSVHSTIFAAIIGGIISGSMTLLGVIHTLKVQDLKEEKKSLPQQIMKGTIYNKELLKMIDGLDNINLQNKSKEQYINEVIEFAELILTRREEFFIEAAIIGYEYYNEVTSVFSEIEILSYYDNYFEYEVEYDEHGNSRGVSYVSTDIVDRNRASILQHLKKTDKLVEELKNRYYKLES